MAKTKYFVSAIGYDSENRVTDHERDIKEFEKNEVDEAYDFFNNLLDKTRSEIIPNETKSESEEVYSWLIQFEECIETKDSIECIDIIHNFSVL